MHASPRVVLFCCLDSLPRSSAAPQPDACTSTLEHLDDAGVVLVLSSRRTRAELDWFTRQLRIRAPFISENGGGVFVPGGCLRQVPGSRPMAGYDVVPFGRSHSSVIEILRKTAARQEIAIRTLADMSIEEASHSLGVPLPLGRLAKLRDYSELFQVSPADRPRLHRALRAVHLHCFGYRGFDLVGATVDSTLGAALLRSLYRRAWHDVVTMDLDDPRAPREIVRDVIAALTRVSAGLSTLVNERFVSTTPGGFA